MEEKQPRVSGLLNYLFFNISWSFKYPGEEAGEWDKESG